MGVLRAASNLTVKAGRGLPLSAQSHEPTGQRVAVFAGRHRPSSAPRAFLRQPGRRASRLLRLPRALSKLRALRQRRAAEPQRPPRILTASSVSTRWMPRSCYAICSGSTRRSSHLIGDDVELKITVEVEAVGIQVSPTSKYAQSARTPVL